MKTVKEISVKELKQLAKKNGIKNYSKMKKNQLIEALKTVKTDKKETTKNEVNQAINEAVNGKPKKKRNIYETEYGREVLQVNKDAKVYENSFEGVVDRLLQAKKEKAVKMTGKQAKILHATKNNTKVHAKLKSLVAAKIAKNFTIFKMLQVVRKNQSDLIKLC